MYIYLTVCKQVIDAKLNFDQSAGAAEGLDLFPNECPDMTLSNLMMKFQWCWSFENVGHLFIAIAPRSTLARNGSTW